MTPRSTSPVPRKPLSSKGPEPTLTKAESFDDSDRQDAEYESDNKPKAPQQKRRRVTRACDECRRKKIKCDGKQPCTHCTVYSYDCTYDQPSNRRRNPAPQYIEALELRLQKAESILRALVPGIDLEDPKHDARSTQQIFDAHNNSRIKPRPQTQQQQQQQQVEDDAQMRSMVDRTGSLDLDDSGFYDYHGNSSGYNFMQKMRAQFGDDFLPNSKSFGENRHFKSSVENRYLANFQAIHGSPKSYHSSPLDAGFFLNNDLPPREVAIELCCNAIDDCLALQQPLHRPTFFARLDAIYQTEPDNYTNNHIRFLPSLYAAMALGCLFGKIEDPGENMDKKAYDVAIERGYQYFNIAKSMMDVSDCRDLVSIQTVLFMILFLQGTAKLSTCYAYVGVALRACCRLGMHRKIVDKFDYIEQEERKRLFWNVRKLDIYVGAMLGLPLMLSNDDIDQDLPTETFDDHITANGLLPISTDAFPLMKAFNAHTRLLRILQKVVVYIYPTKCKDETNTGEAMISHSLIRELERDLQNWMDELPMQLRPSDTASHEVARVQQLLRMSYAYVQMMIYRPFLHYVAQACQTARTDKRSFACAAACVSVARNIVHITSEMKRRGLLGGAYWFVMYTTYFAILALLYFALENPNSTTTKEILRDAVEGRDTLLNLATRSLAADRCSASLASIFEALPEKLNERRSSLRTVPNMGKKRPPPNNDPPFFGNPNVVTSFLPSAAKTAEANVAAPLRTRTMPQEFLRGDIKRLSMPEQSSVVHPGFPYTPDTPYNMSTPTDGCVASTHSTPVPLDFGTPAIVLGQLPDLKSVMFPGDNPFAYPNQPISTLDTMPNLPLGTEGSRDAFGHAETIPTTMQSHLPPEFTSQINAANQQYMNFQMQQAPQQHTHLQTSHPEESDDYWSHAPAKGNFRTGLTPGGPGVNLNLDDIFGNNQPWSMPMNLNMSGNVQQPQNMQWTQQQPGSGWQ